MHTSGISVDETVSQEFASAKNDQSTLYLQYQISNDRFTQVGRGKRSDSREGDFKELQSALKDNEPCFFVAHPQPAANQSVNPATDLWTLIFYMPDGAPVRERMIYSSSSSALRDGLGSSSFLPHTWNVRSKSEMTLSEFIQSLRSEGDNTLLMTSDEIDRLEADKSSHLAMSSTKMSALVGMPVQATDEALQAIERVKSQRGYAVIFKLDNDSEKMQVDEEGVMAFEDISKRLSPTEPRYILTNFAHERDGASAEAFIFHYYCPDALKPKLKMFYSTCKSVAVKQCEAVGVTVTKSIETSDASEISTAAVTDTLYPQASVKKAFDKPARPGRGPRKLIGASPSPEPTA